MQSCPRPLQSTSQPLEPCGANQETLPLDLSPAAKAWKNTSEPQPVETPPGSAAPGLHRSGPPQNGKAEVEETLPEPVEPAGEETEEPPKNPTFVEEIPKSDVPPVEAETGKTQVPEQSLFHSQEMMTREAQMKERDRLKEEQKKTNPDAKAKAKGKAKARPKAKGKARAKGKAKAAPKAKGKAKAARKRKSVALKDDDDDASETEQQEKEHEVPPGGSPKMSRKEKAEVKKQEKLKQKLEKIQAKKDAKKAKEDAKKKAKEDAKKAKAEAKKQAKQDAKKAKAEEKKQAKQDAKTAKDEKGGDQPTEEAEETHPKKRTKTEEKATFARRPRPQNEGPAKRWESLKLTFNTQVAHKFAYPSKMEVWEVSGCSFSLPPMILKDVLYFKCPQQRSKDVWVIKL